MQQRTPQPQSLRRLSIALWSCCGIVVVLMCRPYVVNYLNTELVIAVSKGRYGDVKRALALGASPDGPWSAANPPRWTPPVCDAAQRGETAILRLLLNRGANPNAHVDGDAPAISLAAQIGSTEAVALLLEHGADPLAADGQRTTPLMAGASYVDVTRLLLDHGVPVDTTNVFGQTALHRAAGSQAPESVRLLLQRGAVANRTTSRNVSALQRAILSAPILPAPRPTNAPPVLLTISPAPIVESDAARRRRMETACASTRLLLEAGANPNTRNAFGNTPLVDAAARSPELVEILLKHHADPNLRTTRGQAPLTFAEQFRNARAVRLLREYGAHH